MTLEGAALAFRRPGREFLGLQSRCGRPVAEPVFMARHLLFGLPERTLVEAGPTQVDGRDAWTQTFDTVQGDVSVRVKTVTLVAGGCCFDLILMSPGAFAPAEQAFDAWWRSFRLDPRYDEEVDERSDEDRGA